jgi:hypothetical protein
VDDREAKAIQERLDRWFKVGIPNSVLEIATQLEEKLVRNWEKGISVEGKPLTPVKEETMDMPIRYGDDRRIRRSVNPDKKVPVYATGETARGHTIYKIPNGAEIVNPSAPAQMKLGVNASGTHGGAPRDPLEVGQNTEIYVGRELLKDFDKRVGI